jgi:hypothetical protein
MNQFVHIGYTDYKGNEIPSVTQLLNFIGSDNLTNWANALGLRRIKLRDYLDEVSLAGSIVHDRISHYYEQTDPEPREFLGPKLEEKIDIAFDRFLEWTNALEIKPIWSEKRFSNENYGGTIDLLATDNEDQTILVDFKTSKAPKPTHLLQLAGYLTLIEEKDKEMYDKINLVQIVVLGGPGLQVLSKTIDEMKIYKEAFLKLYEMYELFKKCLKADNWRIK